MAQLQAVDAQLPQDAGERQEYLDRRAAELARKITNQENRMLGGRSLGEIEVRLCLRPDPGLPISEHCKTYMLNPGPKTLNLAARAAVPCVICSQHVAGLQPASLCT